VFLGMHLLFTDPSTAPRTEVGRIMFGVFYGVSTVALYALLGRAGVPPFYDKLLQVPLLNLSVQLLDRVAHSKRLRTIESTAPGRSLAGLAPRRRNLASMALWAGLFALMSALQGVGDRHPGQWVPFWQGACSDERPSACEYLEGMHARFCESGSGWACNEAGILHVTLTVSGEDRRRLDPGDARGAFGRGCDLGFEPACRNLTRLFSAFGPVEFAQAQPTLEDLPIVLRGTKGPITDRSPDALYARACSQGWADTCGH